MKNLARKGNILIVVAIAALITIGAALYFKANTNTSTSPKEQYSESPRPKETINNNFKSYTSQALKISFKYPSDWFIDDRYQMVLLANYQTNLNRDDRPKDNQIEILINNFSNCFPTLEEDLIDPACGQGKVKNKIISKDVKQTSGGHFLKYTLDSYDENQRIQYFFQKGEKILDIEKQPDPSQFEKEFDEIVNSIRFL